MYYNGVILQIALSLGNIVCNLSIVIMKIYDVACKLKDPRFSTERVKTKFFFIFSFLLISNHYY